MKPGKKSMSLIPYPIVEHNGYVRFPRRQMPDPEWDLGQEWRGAWGYKVKRVTNDVEHRPGLAMTKPQLQALINAGWTVTVL